MLEYASDDILPLVVTTAVRKSSISNFHPVNLVAISSPAERIFTACLSSLDRSLS